ncbi:MAG: MFS transporter [Lachnospiraceae bacterium]|nr:MFS transporter [Lachnospiraceae bacterium]
MFKIKNQLSKLYTSSILGNLSLTGAWVAILAARGYSLVEIGIAETVFHIVSLMFEIPSGVLADVFGRKKMLVVSTIMGMISDVVMILSANLFMVCLSIAFRALSYNFSSGSGDALAYDSLRLVRMEDRFERYESNQLMIYRLCSGISTLCAGFALTIGYKAAYGTGLITGGIQIVILLSLREVYAGEHPGKKEDKIGRRLITCFKESFLYLREVRKALWLMFCNSFVGAVDILLLFFLQAKLPEKGMPLWWLGLALLFMEMGGIVGSRLILKMPKIRYRWIFAISTLLVLAGVLAEHSPVCWVMVLGGFIAAVGDDALQVRTNALLQDMFPSEQRATLTSVESFSFSVIMIVLSPLAGIVFTYW